MMERSVDLSIVLDKIESMSSQVATISSNVQNIWDDVINIRKEQKNRDERMDKFQKLLKTIKLLIENNRSSSASIQSLDGQQQEQYESSKVLDRQEGLLPRQQQKQVQHIVSGQEHSNWYPHDKSQKDVKFPLRHEYVNNKQKSKLGLDKRQQFNISFYENYEQIQDLGLKTEQNHVPVFSFINEKVLSQEFQDRLAKVFDKMNLKLFKCEQVYSYPAMAQINFHQKIDNKDNLLILIEMCNNNTIGAFTQLCFNSKPNYIPKSNPRSFLCNLSKQRFLFASRINKTHSYDKNYLIFGNWEIKIKIGQKFLQSSLGKKGSCFAKSEYDREGPLEKDVRQWLFGEIIDDSQDKRLEFKSYSIFIFK